MLDTFYPSGNCKFSFFWVLAVQCVNLGVGDFVQKFNAATASMMGDTVGVALTVYEDRTYDFVIKTPPVAGMLFKAAGIEKGS